MSLDVSEVREIISSKILPNTAPDVKNLDELIQLGQSTTFYTNIDMRMLHRIMPNLLELQKMVGLKKIKQNIFQMVIYFLQHLHLNEYESDLYSPLDPITHIDRINYEIKKFEQELEEQKKRERQKREEKEREEAMDRHREYLRKRNEAQKRKYNCESSSNHSNSDEHSIKRLKLRRYPPEPLVVASSPQPLCSKPLEQKDDIPLPLPLPLPIPFLTPQTDQGEYYHTMIIGSPGSGKTQLAKIIGNILANLHIFKTENPTNTFVLAHRDDFVAEYLGQSAIKTRKFLDKHRGGVVMIDEAYSLGDTTDKFCVEVIDTLVSYLSEHRNDICVIFVGYKDYLMKRLFSMNHGLKRRIPWIHEIDPYTPEELSRIFLVKVESNGWKCSFSLEKLTKLIGENRSIFEFAGGDIENLFNLCKVRECLDSFSKDISKRRTISYGTIKKVIEDKRERDSEQNHIQLSLYT